MDKKAVFKVVPISEIIVDKEFNVYAPASSELFDNLQESLGQTGQLHPVIVNRTEDGCHLVAGEQRVRALMEADAETVECKVFQNMTELEKAEVSIIENEQRRAPSPMDQARGMVRLRELGRNTRQISDLYGVSADTVIRREKLLELNPEVQKMIERPIHPLPIHQAQLLTGLSESGQIQLARKIAPRIGPIMGEKEAREMVDIHVKGPQFPESKPDKNKKTPAESTSSSTVPSDSQNDSGAQTKKNAKAGEKLQAVKGGFSITPSTFKINADGQVTVTGVMTVRLVGDGKHPQLHGAKLTNFVLGLDEATTAEVIKLMKKCQKKATRKKSSKR
jgi:ParB/RepB/Spo0J family partition protein